MPTPLRSRSAAAALAVCAVVLIGCSAVGPSPRPRAHGVPDAPAHSPARCAELQEASRSNPPLYDPATTWNLPAACFPTRSDSARWANNWFVAGNRPGRTDPSQRGAMNVAFDEYSTPVYQLADATTQIRVFISSWGYGDNLGETRLLPWNPTWRPAAGNDHEMIIADPATGREWGLWGVQLDNWSTCATLGNLLAGYQPGTDLCAAMAWLGHEPDGTVSNYWSSSGFSNGFGRGFADVMGLALLPTLDEVERGSIHHALNLETYGTMFGPACTPAQMGTAAAGVECGYAVAPATRLEWADGPATQCQEPQPGTPGGRAQTVPEGMRFALQISDDEIETWLDGRQLVGRKRDTARIFAVALRDYGWIISDTSCWASSISVEGVANPAARERWAALGVTDPGPDGASLLQGLITSAEQVRTLESPDPEPILTSH